MQQDLTQEEIDMIFERHHRRSETILGTDKTPWRVQALKSAFHRFIKEDKKLEPGEIVTWKIGLRNRGLPEYHAPAIVVEVFDYPVENLVTHNETCVTIDRVDVLLGAFEENGDFLLFCADSQRIERMTFTDGDEL